MSTFSSGLIYSQNGMASSQSSRNRLRAVKDNPRLTELMKSLYQADQQAQYLYLQAEVEFLLQRLQTLEQRRQTSVKSEVANRRQ